MTWKRSPAGTLGEVDTGGLLEAALGSGDEHSRILLGMPSILGIPGPTQQPHLVLALPAHQELQLPQWVLKELRVGIVQHRRVDAGECNHTGFVSPAAGNVCLGQG